MTTNFKEMDDEQIAKRRQTLSTQADNLYEQLMSLTNGEAQLDTYGARFEALFTTFLEEGICSQRVLDIIEVRFLETSLEFLVPGVEEFVKRNAQAQARSQIAVARRKGVILGPQGQPISGG